MALPVVKSLTDCVDFHRTVEPYIPQLYDLPQQFLQAFPNLQALKTLYVSTNPLISAFAFTLFLFPVFFAASEINRNYSQVDRFWSILPTLYNAHYAVYAHAVGLPTDRLDTILALSVVWSLRLSFNYWRKGGYNVGSEDYRWEVLRKHLGRAGFFLLNVTFISSLQLVLLFSITMPTYALLLVARRDGNGLEAVDKAFAAGILGIIGLTMIADQQQWNFHGAKETYQKTAKAPKNYPRNALDLGFNTFGLWAYSRHPNFAAEQSFWVSLYLWSCSVTHNFWNYTGFGAVGYLLLFQGSTMFTEYVTSGKYPEYKRYQKKVGMFMPIPGFKWSDSDTSKASSNAMQKQK